MNSHQTKLYHTRASNEPCQQTEDLETGVRPCSQLSELKEPDISRSSLAIRAQASLKESRESCENIIVQHYEPEKVSQSTSSGNAKDDEIKIQDYEQESSHERTAGGRTTDGPSDTDLKRQKCK